MMRAGCAVCGAMGSSTIAGSLPAHLLLVVSVDLADGHLLVVHCSAWHTLMSVGNWIGVQMQEQLLVTAILSRIGLVQAAGAPQEPHASWRTHHIMA